MGGFGSGRVSTRLREQVENTRFIRAQWVRDQWPTLKAGITTRVSWTRGGEPYGAAGVSLIDNRLHIEYRQRPVGTVEWKEVHAVVELSYTTPHFGGKRLWLQCPYCGHRVAALYCSEVVACRQCLQLAYRTEGEDAIDRLRSKATKLKGRLGGNPYHRPKGMHQRTFLRLREQYFSACFRAEELQEERWRKLLQRLRQKQI